MLLQGGRKAALGVALTSRAVSRSPVGSALAPRASRTYARQQQSWDDDAGSGGSGDGDERRNGPRQERTSTWRAPRDLPPHWADRKDGKGAEPPKKRKKQPRVIQHPPPSEADLQRYAEMRVRRAERLERKDLTSQLTPVKTCKLLGLTACSEIRTCTNALTCLQTWAASRSLATSNT